MYDNIVITIDLKFIIFQDGFKKLSQQMYDSFSDNMEFWVKTLYQEANETIHDIWSNAHPFADEFLDDIR